MVSEPLGIPIRKILKAFENLDALVPKKNLVLSKSRVSSSTSKLKDLVWPNPSTVQGFHCELSAHRLYPYEGVLLISSLFGSKTPVSVVDIFIANPSHEWPFVESSSTSPCDSHRVEEKEPSAWGSSAPLSSRHVLLRQVLGSVWYLCSSLNRPIKIEPLRKEARIKRNVW